MVFHPKFDPPPTTVDYDARTAVFDVTHRETVTFSFSIPDWWSGSTGSKYRGSGRTPGNYFLHNWRVTNISDPNSRPRSVGREIYVGETQYDPVLKYYLPTTVHVLLVANDSTCMIEGDRWIITINVTKNN